MNKLKKRKEIERYLKKNKKKVYPWDFEDLFGSIDIEDLITCLNNFYSQNNFDNIIIKIKGLCNLV